MNMVALYESTLVETFTIGTSLSWGKRAGLIQSERTPTRKGEKASPSAWLTRICAREFKTLRRINQLFFWSNNQIIKARSIYQISPKKCQKRYKMPCLNCRREATATGDDDIHRHVADDGPVKKLTQCSNCPGMWESQLLTYQLQLRRSPAINVRRRHWLTLCRATRNPANSTGGGQKHISFRCITGSCISFTWHAE